MRCFLVVSSHAITSKLPLPLMKAAATSVARSPGNGTVEVTETELALPAEAP